MDQDRAADAKKLEMEFGFVEFDDKEEKITGRGTEKHTLVLEEKLVESLAAVGVPTESTDLDGRSDYAAFLAAGIAVGGIFTGAEERKSAEQARRWGGQADAPFDPCYHQACDRIDRIDRVALDRNTDALAGTLATYALSTAGLKS